jgi:hypothetical protein
MMRADLHQLRKLLMAVSKAPRPRAYLGALLFVFAACDDLIDPRIPVGIEIALPAAGARAGAAFTQQPIVRIVNAYGAIAAAATEEVTVTVSAGATIVGTATGAPINGVVSFTDLGLFGPTGEYTLTYTTSLPDPAGAATQSITVAAGPAAALALSTPAAGAAGGEPFVTQPVVRITDGAGNLATDASGPVTLAVSSGANVVGTGSAAVTGGVATFAGAGLSGPAGAYTLTYSSPAGTVTQPITVAPGTPAQYRVVSGASTAVVGSNLTVSAQLSDASGAPVPRSGRTVTWSSTGAGGAFSTAISATDANGLATVTFRVDTLLTANSATITATDASSVTGSVNVAVTSAAAARLAFVQQPTTAGWRTTMPQVRVAVQDRYGNQVFTPSHDVTLSLAANPSGATLAGGSAVTTTDGVATFSGLLLDKPGTGYTLRATTGSLNGTSSSFDVTSVAVIMEVHETLTGLSVSGESVYVVARSSSDALKVWKLPVIGGEGTVVAKGAFAGLGGNGYRAINAGSEVAVLYESGTHSCNGHMIRINAAGATEKFLGSHCVWPDFEFDGSHFYVSFTKRLGLPQESGVLRMRASDDSRTQAVVRPMIPPTLALAISDGYLFFSDTAGTGNAIKKMPVAGGTTTTVVPIGKLSTAGWRTMIVIGGTLYWAESGDGSPAAGSIRSVPIGGGTASTRVSNLTPNVHNLVSDGTYLYVNDGGSLRRYDLPTFSATTIEANDKVVDVALDAEAVYWTTSTTPGRLKKTRK